MIRQSARLLDAAPQDGSHHEVNDWIGVQWSAINGRLRLTGGEFASIDPGLCPRCLRPLRLQRIDVSQTNFVYGQRRFLPGRLECASKCF